MATALYRRYRPESFAEVIGQDHVTTPLRRALRNGRIGHAYLFSGPRGCGKTTSARILARCLNCAEGPTDTPCGVCDSCRDLSRDGAGSLDVVEIDAASHGGVDDARELRERASFAPVRDRFKVFIIDEAHMVTSAGFNALLKLVEEPPEHVKFVFATTEPDKVIGTIRSRTHHYPFRLIPPQVLTPYLEEVCQAEGVQVGEGVLSLVVRAGGGSARDTMSVLDQLMAGAGEDGLDHQTAIALLGFTDTALLDQAVTAVSARDAAGLYDAVEQVLATGHEPRRFVEDLLERMRDLIILAAVPDRGQELLPQVPADELDRMREQAAGFVPADLSRCGDLVHETLSTMSGATSPRLHLELLAARLVLRDARAGAAPQGGAPATSGAQPASGGAPAPAAGGGGGREEARRIAQERSEAARRARGGASRPAPEARQEPARPAPGAGPPAGSAAEEPAAEEPAAQAPPQDEAAPARPEQRAEVPPAPASGAAREDSRSRAAASWGDAVPPAPCEQVPAASEGAPAHSGTAPSRPALDAPASEAPVQEEAAPEPSSGAGAAEVQAHWSAILDELSQIRRPSWALVSQNATVLDLRGSILVLGFRTEGLVAAFRRGTAAENLADAVRRILRQDVTIEPVVGEGPGGQGGSAGPGGPGAGGGSRGPAAQSGPGGPSTGGSRPPAGPTGPGGRGAQGAGADPQGPGGPGGPRAAATPDARTMSGSASDPGRGPGSASPPPRGGGRPWGDAAPATPARGRAAGPVTMSPPPADDEFPPEPDDPYPPDPQEEGRYAARPQPAAPAQASGSRWGDAVPARGGDPAQGGHPGGGRGAADPGVGRPPRTDDAPNGSSAPLAADGEVPEVEDEGRDSVPEGEPRTHGQAAIRRAIAEGCVVRSLPAAQRGSTTADDTAAPVTGAATGVLSPGSPDGPDSGAGTSAGTEGTGEPRAHGAASPPPTTGDAPRSPATTWEPARRPGGDDPVQAAAAPSGPSATASAPTAPAPSAPAPSGPAPAAPRSGAALARQAAQQSREAAQASRRPGARPSPATEPARDEDPTGGASRDDEDAVYASRSGREVIESVLGGRVLEVIDETPEQYR
ncbi:DNA polymerase III subunit gamma and tau [Brachybacterium squillarum]|uniref:DNA polymerase III subunit gamma and tau n=1 Tax=Brachybacterium squillarum TaxID=661979 RepID=UPI00026295B1|nr:DNA polymerase III subunit gamma and tau [Brachybacterium squillarum]